MKLVLKNSSLVFQNSKYEEQVKSVQGQYISPNYISTSLNYNLLIFKVIEGGKYQIKSSPAQWPSHGVDTRFCILDSPDCNNSNCGTVEDFNTHLLQVVGAWSGGKTSITLDFVANESGYLYLSENIVYGTFTLEMI